jgi:hypothetical protein
MERSRSRASMFRFFGVVFWSWSFIALGCLGFLAPVAHGEDITVEFEGRIGLVCDVSPFPFNPCPEGYSIDPGVFIGAPFSGTYTLSTTHDGTIGGNIFSQIYRVSPTTGSIEIGSLSAVGSEDPILGTQIVLINNDFPFFSPFGVFDSWTLVPLQSDASSGGAISSDDPDLFPHYCQIFFAKNFDPDKLDGTGYFVNDTLDGWGLDVPEGSRVYEGSIQCFAGFSFLQPFTAVLFGGRINSIRQVVPNLPVDIDLKPGSDPNCVKTNSKGSVPVAILGASDLDVTQIDQSSLEFGGANPPQRCALADQAPTDGIPDLTCHFATSAVAWPAPGSECGDVTLTGELVDGTAIEGSDLACLTGEAGCN